MQTQTVLKSYFQHGDVPSESQFVELIDTMFELFANAQAIASSAVATANAAAAAAPKALLKHVTNVGVQFSTNLEAPTVTWQGSVQPFYWQLVLEFTTPLAHGNYVVMGQADGLGTAQVLTPTSNGFTIRLPGGTSAGQQFTIFIAVF